jgi:hypothetical protein
VFYYYSSLLIFKISFYFWSRNFWNFSLSFFSVSLNSFCNYNFISSFSFSNSSIFSFKTSICNLSCCSTLIWFLISASYYYNYCSCSFGGKSIDLNVEDRSVPLKSLPKALLPLFRFKLFSDTWSMPTRCPPFLLTVWLPYIFPFPSSFICISISIEVLI